MRISVFVRQSSNPALVERDLHEVRCMDVPPQIVHELRSRGYEGDRELSLRLRGGAAAEEELRRLRALADGSSVSGVRRRQILLVEDDADIREALVDALRMEGFGVTPALSGEAALEALRRRELPDVVLSDVIMPHLTGLELLRAAREDLGLRTPFVLMSGHRPEEVGAPCRCLQKPFELDDLLGAVHEALGDDADRRDDDVDDA